MELASRLRDTSLGDLLGALHRATASGVLELIEPHTRHAIHLRRGHVQAVESDAYAVRLGEVAARLWGVPRPALERARLWAHARGLRIGQALVAQNVLSPTELDALLSAQQRERLERLYSLADAEIRFRVAQPLPPGASERSPLSAREAFHGRPRRTTREGHAEPPPTQRAPHGSRAVYTKSTLSPRLRWLAVLGLDAAATADEIRARYRKRVLELHPDRAPEAPMDERAERGRRLAAVIEAYRALTAPSSGAT